MTLGMDKNHSETTRRTRWRDRRAALGLMATLLALPAMAQGGGAVLPVSIGLPATTTPTTPPTGTATTPAQVPTSTPRWGEGVLELEFLRKLRVFLETDPFDFKAFEAAFGVPLEVSPPNGPHPDGSWGIGDIRLRHPFGQTFNNRSRGGVKWSFDSSRNTSYVSMEFVKMPPAGKRDGDGLPCITQDHFIEAFDSPRWTRGYDILRYSDGLPVYGAPLYTATSESGVNVRFLLHVTGCIPYLTVAFNRLPPHPGAARLTP